ncbi:MAG TPA: M14 family metallopeptidase [Amycolatopsis sp.]|nr:M14 family metallopeptidase [Amycolatopsis sp.]
MTVTPLDFTEFPDFAALTKLLREWAAACPDLATLESVGSSWEGRDVWLLTLTNRNTGPDNEKPGFFIEAGIHATEWTGGFAALHLVNQLLMRYGVDERVSRLLDTRTIYVLPRLGPDGYERTRAEGRFIRSTVRPHPADRPGHGLRLCDVDGDGRTLFMRVPDPEGPWKKCEREPRLLVRREPDEVGGDYFRLFQEGVIEGYAGDDVVPVADPVEGIDLGQNLPTDWAAAPRTPDNAGPFPGSEPETQAVLHAVVGRKNICGYVTCHTFGALHLRPPLNRADDFPYVDQRVYDVFGQKAEELTGYEVMSFHDLKHDPDLEFRGGQLGWYYHQLGLFAWITEFWNPKRAAGITTRGNSGWLGDPPLADALKLIEWSDTELDGRGYVDWYPFDHPQLGPVELGGWDMINYWYNPPLDRIEAEVAPHTEWIIFQALASPLLRIRSIRAEEIRTGVHRVRAVVANVGWLPTYVTQKALDRGLVRELTAEIQLPRGSRLVTGEREVRLGQLEGRTGARSTTTWWGHQPGTPDLAAVEWVVEAPRGTAVTVRAAHQRAGVAQAEVRLGGSEDGVLVTE